MSEEPPKLFTYKPKKPKKAASASLSATTSSSGAAAVPPPPHMPPPSSHRLPQPPLKEPFLKRYKFLWPLLLFVNFGIGGYVLLRTTMKDDRKSKAEKEITKVETSSSSNSTPAPTIPATESLIANTVLEPRVRAQIEEDQQRELFKWMLEEKRKLKPRDSDEKKRIDDEKAILKQFILAKSIPTI